MKKTHQNVGIVAFPICEAGEAPDDTKAGNIPFSDLVDILHQLFDNLYVITGNEERVSFKKNDRMYISVVQHRGGTSLIGRGIKYLLTQIKLSRALFKMSKNVNLWIFFIGAEALLFPMLTARLLRKQAVLALTGFPAKVSEEEKAPSYKPIECLAKINLILSSRIIAYSERIVAERHLEKYRSKISVAQRHFIDFGQFNIQTPLGQRDNLVAYIGRLSEGKGIPEFMEAISRILDSRADASFLIGGDGPLRGSVEAYLNTAKPKNKVDFAGWIPHDELPGYLNKVKLLVLPSYTEALPNIILEAMACGTPVLATAVGAIPDIITDGETGFILEDNSADCIASNIIRALDHPNLEEIAAKARALIESNFTYKAAVERYREALSFG